MTKVDISDETMVKLKEFKKVVDVILADEPIENEVDYVELVISQGLNSILRIFYHKKNLHWLKQ